MATSTSTTPKQASPMEILAHRKARKEAGLAGCITGKPVSTRIVFGFSDIQSWRPTNPMDPHCFCFDCRGLWDSEGTIDAELVNTGHAEARWVYWGLTQTNSNPTLCEDCGKEEAEREFHHLDDRIFHLCGLCFSLADHEDYYLAHVKPPRLRVCPPSVDAGLSNKAPAGEQPETPSLPTRTNGGGIEAL